MSQRSDSSRNKMSCGRLDLDTSAMVGKDDDRELNAGFFTSESSHGRARESLDEVCSNIDAEFSALLKVLRRRTWSLLPDGKSTACPMWQRLRAAEWEYARIIELWRVHDGHNPDGQSSRLQDWFEERLARLYHILTDWTCAVSRRRKSFVDHDASLLSLEAAMKSLNEAMLTRSLDAKLNELIVEGYSV